MSDNITLRRAAEQARDALNRILDCEQSCECLDRRTLAALDAALAEPDAKREPATDATDNRRVWDAYIEACREFERFHGLTKEDK